ncbi:PAS domain-containing protein [Terasakiella sp. SH-1]|uniref:PAS domain-containing protein n=1 Tax=Terasakiella sp. SH-1 TaxID=2560057 RepID=UPI0010737C51|nr:PAS domain-containing protein [Terasakiella sp. SH-1]
MQVNPVLTGCERVFDVDEVIVSKTDLKGKITYANRTFAKLAGVSPKDAVGKPHNFIRHPDMPRSVFKLLWETVSGGDEIFAYVINRSLNGDHYWVLAHVTPSYGKNGQIVGYHSNRRATDRPVIDEHIIPLYAELTAIESTAISPKEGLKAGYEKLMSVFSGSLSEYNKYILSLGGA